MSDLDTRITILAQARDEVAERKAEIERLKAELAETMLAKEIAWAEEGLKHAKDAVQANEDAIRELAIAEYDGENKKVRPCLQIKTFTVASYDADQMKEWAIRHNHPAMLNLNKRAADKVAKGPTAPDFVIIKTEDRVTIATDLSDYVTAEA